MMLCRDGVSSNSGPHMLKKIIHCWFTFCLTISLSFLFPSFLLSLLLFFLFPVFLSTRPLLLCTNPTPKTESYCTTHTGFEFLPQHKEFLDYKYKSPLSSCFVISFLLKILWLYCRVYILRLYYWVILTFNYTNRLPEDSYEINSYSKHSFLDKLST